MGPPGTGTMWVHLRKGPSADLDRSRSRVNGQDRSSTFYAYLGPVYTGPDKSGTGALRDLIASIPKRSHESGPKLFQIARPFTWDRIVHQIAKITAAFVERHLVVEDERTPRSQNIEE